MNPLRGQNNVQGANDAGATPIFYPGYQRVDDASRARASSRRPGACTLPPKDGLNLNVMMKETGPGRASRACTSWARTSSSPSPTSRRSKQGLNELRVPGLPGDLPQRDDAVRRRGLPGGLLRREGRRVHQQRPPRAAGAQGGRAAGRGPRGLGDPVRPGPRRRLPDAATTRRPREIYDEMAALTPKFAGISHARLEENVPPGCSGPARQPTTPARRRCTWTGRSSARQQFQAVRVSTERRTAGRRLPAGAFDRPHAVPLQRGDPDPTGSRARWRRPGETSSRSIAGTPGASEISTARW